MFLETKKVITQHTRISKLKKSHAYSRTRTVAIIKCDNCESLFERDLGKIDYRRLNNIFFHVCSNCDAKKFAQSKGVERRRIWGITADSEIDISKF